MTDSPALGTQTEAVKDRWTRVPRQSFDCVDPSAFHTFSWHSSLAAPGTALRWFCCLPSCVRGDGQPLTRWEPESTSQAISCVDLIRPAEHPGDVNSCNGGGSDAGAGVASSGAVPGFLRCVCADLFSSLRSGVWLRHTVLTSGVSGTIPLFSHVSKWGACP